MGDMYDVTKNILNATDVYIWHFHINYLPVYINYTISELSSL